MISIFRNRFLHLQSVLARSVVNVSGSKVLVNTQELCNRKILVGENVHGSASQEKLEWKLKGA
jgi:hypothetical protein